MTTALLLSRRTWLLGAATTPMLIACASPTPAPSAWPPIVFVHGNGDSAALWLTTLWRFESNGWPRSHLHAFDMPYPLARDNDALPQAGRSGTAECLAQLQAEVEKVLRATGARQVVLMAHSRGGYAVRNYLAQGEGAAKVSHVILCGTPNHGTWSSPAINTGNEFNGAGPFLKRLNTPQGPKQLEVTPGPKWLTLRSDDNDKYAQLDAQWLGARGQPTNVGFDSPALRGATNQVLPGADHRETAFSPAAFAAAYRFITGQAPATTTITSEGQVVLDGTLSGYGAHNHQGSAPSNLPLVGAQIELYETDPLTGERQGAAVHRKTVGDDGQWGPFHANPRATYEFVISAPDYATTHIYRSPFPRSSRVVHLRAERLAPAPDNTLTAALVTLSRPRGYFGLPRDRIALDGQSPPAGISHGTAGVSVAQRAVTETPPRTVIGEFNGERIAARTWPLAEGHLTFIELTY